MAFAVTPIEDADMAIAASNGVTRPATANGTNTALYPSAMAKFCSASRFAARATPTASSTGASRSPCIIASAAIWAMSEAVAGEMDEDVFQRWFAEGDRLDVGGEGFDQPGDPLMALRLL